MTLPHRLSVPGLSGERFHVRYLILADGANEARSLAEDICIEQTVEFPASKIPEGDIRDHLVGRVEQFELLQEGRFAATISYAVESAGTDLLQLLNVILGLTSLLRGVAVDWLDLPEHLLSRFKGPRFGVGGVRDKLGVTDRPLLCTSLKPMGLSPEQLADLAYRCTLGGLDIVKDDHAITDLAFCPFEERVERCAEAVARANRETGLNCIYAVNVTAPAGVAVERARFARRVGAGAVMISPALTGFDLMRQLALDDEVGLPVLSHPTYGGGFLARSEASGFSHDVYYGQIPRLAGADVSIFANYGGRFPITPADSHGAVDGCRARMGSLRPIFPMLGGGMKLDRIRALREEFGQDSIFLVGGGLHTASDDLVANVRRFVETVQ